MYAYWHRSCFDYTDFGTIAPMALGFINEYNSKIGKTFLFNGDAILSVADCTDYGTISPVGFDSDNPIVQRSGLLFYKMVTVVCQ